MDNITMNNNVPIILSSPKALQFDQDCACPVQIRTALNNAVILDSSKELKINSTIYREHIAPDFELFFNQFEPDGIYVLNYQAISLMERFAIPQSFSSVIAGVYSEKSVEQDVVSKMVDAKLLIAVNKQVDDLINSGAGFSKDVLETWFHLTNECNLRCDYCFVGKTQDVMSTDVVLESVDAVFRSAVQNNFKEVKLKYAGGEPLLNMKGLKLAHNYATELSARTGIMLQEVVLTNGTVLTADKARYLKEHKIRIMVSLDGMGEDHDIQRHYKNHKGSFDLVEKSISILLQMGYPPNISITITDRSCAGLANLVKWLLERKLHFTFNFYRESDFSANMKGLMYKDSEIIDSLNKAFDEISKNPPSYNLLGMLSDRARLDLFHSHTCGVGDSYMVISHKGEISKCHMHMDKPLGTIKDQDPLNLLRSDRLGLQNLPVDQKKECNTCDWRNVCTGGCPALTYRVTGRYDIKSPNCNIYKSIFPKILKLEAERLIRIQDIELQFPIGMV